MTEIKVIQKVRCKDCKLGSIDLRTPEILCEHRRIFLNAGKARRCEWFVQKAHKIQRRKLWAGK